MDDLNGVDGVILAVVHEAYRNMQMSGIAELCLKDPALLIDVKGAFSPQQAEALGITYWRL